MDFKVVLKNLARFGYPKEGIFTLLDTLDYNSDDFVPDLFNTLGEDKAYEFVNKTFEKLEGKNGIRVPLWEPGEFVDLIIENFHVDLDESEYCVFIDWKWGESRVLDDMGRFTTLEGMNEDNDPWDLDDFYDQLKTKVGDYIFKRTCICIMWGI